jgi:YegS/Rv2252/BmrU family lipid kinase
MDSKYISFIVNPVAGGLNKEPLISQLKSAFPAGEYEISIEISDRPGQAFELAQAAVARRATAVVAVGGDGTLNEVGRALVNTDIPMGIIPNGSGNGLVRHLGIPLDTERAINTIKHPSYVSVDAGKMNGHLFFCAAGMGMDAEIAAKFNKSGARGLSSYLRGAFSTWRGYQPQLYQLIGFDGRIHKMKALMVTVSNASQIGNGAWLAPDALSDDGYLDISVLKPFSLLNAPALVYRLFTKGALKYSKSITRWKCQTFTIVREREGLVHLDGETMTLPAEIKLDIIRKALKVIVPAS